MQMSLQTGRQILAIRFALMTLLLPLAITSTTMPGKASADTPEPAQVVAIFDIRAEGLELPDRSRSLLTGYLASRLTATGKYSAIPGASIRKAMVELKIESQQDCYDDACRIELGRAAAAHMYIGSLIWKVDGVCSITLDLYDLRAETMVKSVEQAGLGCKEAALRAGINAAVAKLTGLKEPSRVPQVQPDVPPQIRSPSYSQPSRAQPAPTPISRQPAYHYTPNKSNDFLHDIIEGRIRVEWFGMSLGAGRMKLLTFPGLTYEQIEEIELNTFGLIDVNLFTLVGKNWYLGLLEGSVLYKYGRIGLGSRLGYQHHLKRNWVMRAGLKAGWVMTTGWRDIHLAEVAPHLQFLKVYDHGSVGVGFDFSAWTYLRTVAFGSFIYFKWSVY